MPSPFVTRATGGVASADRVEIRRALSVLIDPSHAYQIQSLPSGTWIHCGTIDEGVEAAYDHSDGAGVYWMLNPFESNLGHPPKKHEILSRRWLLVDVDVERPDTNSNSTEAEKREAGDVICAILEYLEGLGWPGPVMNDSGNGWHLLYRIDLPNTPLAQQLLKEVLAELGDRFDSDKAKVDRSVHNANRICKLPGTWARKGPHSDERPHRMTRMMAVPNPIEVVTLDQLEALVRKEEKPLPVQPLDAKAPGFHARATNGDLGGYVRSAIDRECYRILTATPGASAGRNNALNRAAHSLGTLAGWPEMSEGYARAELLRAALQAGLGDGESLKTIESGWSAGASKPRERPKEQANGKGHANGKLPDPPKRLAKLSIGLDEITPEKVDWLWEDRIAVGFISIFAGRTGLGKSFVLCDAAARMSRGEPPKYSNLKPGAIRTMIISEDPLKVMLGPRLLELKADKRMIRFMTWEAMGIFTINNTEMLDQLYAECDGFRFLIVDPPANFLGDVDEHKNSEVRNALMQLVAWLDINRVACVFVCHVNKAVGKGLDAVERIVGSVAWGSVARITVAFAKDPDNPGQLLCGGTKNNLGETAHPLSFRIVKTDSLAVIDWLGKSDTSMEDAMNKMKSPTKKVQAAEWFIKKFRERLEWPEKELEAEYVAMGISRTTYFQARSVLSIQSRPIRDSGRRVKHWVLWVPENWPYLTQNFVGDLNSGNSGTVENRKSSNQNDLGDSVQNTNESPQVDSGSRVPESQSPTVFPREDSEAARNREEINQVFSKEASPPWDEDLESPEKRWERRRFKIGTWLRNLLWGAPAPADYVLKVAKEAGFEEAEIKEVARLIGVDMNDTKWVYRGF